jgi:tetratricopeptide (TPR) repeat protein
VARRDVNIAGALLKRKNYDQALKSGQKALERAPLASAHALIGDVHAARGDCATALRSYQQALRLDPKDATALAGQAACGK